MQNSVEVPKKFKVALTYDPAIPLLGKPLEKTRIPKDTCTPMLIAALFTAARTWKPTKRPSAEEWIKMWCVYIMGYSPQKDMK